MLYRGGHLWRSLLWDSKEKHSKLFLTMLLGFRPLLLAGTQLLVDDKAVGHSNVQKMLESFNVPPLCSSVGGVGSQHLVGCVAPPMYLLYSPTAVGNRMYICTD
ncbi:hypothetical protein CRENBAI_026181 [Crenichthys baileyi]|uniref:Uncharacterized protein n=1 Tax=Crenichthys baileyi TaxID=28760 RepID=A0AAV9RHC7_9TELE